jgi:hypothetical protein
VLFTFLFLNFVASLSFKDVLHLSFYPIGAGVFAGAAFALVTSVVVALLVAVGFIPDIKYDFTQWGEKEQVLRGFVVALRECGKAESLVYTVVATGLQEAYSSLRPPIDAISYIRPLVGLLYLVVTASVFAAVVKHRKRLVFGMVLLGALIATVVNIAALKAYLDWNAENSSCEEQVAKGQFGFGRILDAALPKMAVDLNSSAKPNDVFMERRCQAEGRSLLCTYRFKRVIPPEIFNGFMKRQQKYYLDGYCSGEGQWLRDIKATTSHTYYSSEGERLTSFSIGPADCPQW